MLRSIGMLVLMLVLSLGASATFADDSSAMLESARSALRLKDYAKAQQVLLTAAQANDAEAQYLLGSMYRNGVGVEQDLGQARRWLEAAARQNHTASQYSLATLLTNEEPRDVASGKEWLQRAAAGGHPMAQQTLQRNALPLQFQPERDLTERKARGAALFAAIGRDDVATVAAFPEVDLKSVVDDFGRGAFAHAANACASATAKLLATHGVAVDRTDHFGATPLMLAARCANTGVLAILLTAKVDVNTQDAVGNSALAYAARAGSVAAVKQLLLAGADVRVTNRQGWSALDWSLRAQATDIARELRMRGASSLVRAPTSSQTQTGPFNHAPAPFTDLYRGWPDLLIAAARQSSEALSFLLQSGGDPNLVSAEGYTPLSVAVFTNHVANVDALLAAGAKLSGMPVPVGSLRGGLRDGNDALIRAFLARPQTPRSVEAVEEPLLVQAIRAQQPAAVGTLLDARVEVDQRGRDGVTALMLAAKRAQKEAVLQLLRAGARADLTDAAGRTALWYAAAAGAVDCIPLLAANAQSEQSASSSSLSVAAAAGRVDVIAALLKSGVTVKTAAPLAIAAARGHVEVIAALLSAGATIDAPDRFGNTALIAAARAGQLPAARVLLAAGANKSLRNQDRANAHDVAAAMGFAELATLLEK